MDLRVFLGHPHHSHQNVSHFILLPHLSHPEASTGPWWDIFPSAGLVGCGCHHRRSPVPALLLFLDALYRPYKQRGLHQREQIFSCQCRAECCYGLFYLDLSYTWGLEATDAHKAKVDCAWDFSFGRFVSLSPFSFSFFFSFALFITLIANSFVLLLIYSACVAGVVRIYFLTSMFTSADPTWTQADGFIWSSIESCIGIVCACLPTLRPLIRALLPCWLGTTAPRYSKPVPSNDIGQFHALESSSANVYPSQNEDEIMLTDNIGKNPWAISSDPIR